MCCQVVLASFYLRERGERMLGTPEMLVILAVILLFFGAKRLPGLGKALGESVSKFKKEIKEGNTRDVEELGESKEDGKKEGPK